MRRFRSILMTSITVAAVETALIVLAGFAQEPSSQPLAVYIAALKGECLDEKIGFGIVNGRSFIASAAIPPNRAISRLPGTSLNPFEDDPITHHLVENEFMKHKAIRLVNSAHDANVVFCLCTQYQQMKPPSETSRRMDFPDDARVFTFAAAVAPAAYFASPMDPLTMSKDPIWSSNTIIQDPPESPMTPKKEKKGKNPPAPSMRIVINGIQLDSGKDILPYDLARRFAGQLPELTEQIRSLP